MFNGKCRFGADRGVSHYVLKREMVILTNHDHFELEKCVKERGGRAARCIGSVPVAEMLASVAPRAPMPDRVTCAYDDPIYSIFPDDRSRESCGTWQLPQTTTITTAAATTYNIYY